jgi:maltooligosyltrehalose trehalohydrolase
VPAVEEKVIARPPLGAVVEGGETEVRVWAPASPRVSVRADGRDFPLAAGDDGVHEGRLPIGAGTRYELVLEDGSAWPDPSSRSQPDGVRGASEILDTASFSWSAPKPGLRLDELVLYELHVGTFSDAGTFDGAIPHLAGLAELGVTAVEVMPIATFPGNRGWGYDGLYTSAPHPAYGGPSGFARFVDAAHAAGLGVVLDVVYNHVGPGNEALRAFGPYFTDRHETFWGDALDYSERGVREWAIQNAELWVRDYRVDGLRLDAVHAVFDDSPTHVLVELAERVRALDQHVLLIDEMETGDLRPIEEWGHDAQWADEFHHELHVLLTGEREGYYADYGSLEGLAAQLGRTPAERLVVCSQNHDQVGNRALGDRPAADELLLRAALLLFAPQTPLLFQGEEYGERRPFQFFTDHIDPFIADATREGRRREFAAFSAFTGAEVPDPQSVETFAASKLDRSAADPDVLAFYRRLLALRRELPREVETRVEGQTLRVRRGRAELVADFATKTVELSA